MHHKKIYPIVHKIHHISLNPTPWAAFSFHPIEAFIQIAWIPIIIFFVPTHIFTIAIWVMYIMLFNVIGHLGYEFFPKNFIKSGRFISAEVESRESFPAITFISSAESATVFVM